MLVDGELVLYVERGGKTLLSWTDEPSAAAVRGRRAGPRGPRGGPRQAHRREGRRGAVLGSGHPLAAALAEAGSMPPRAACGCAGDRRRPADARAARRWSRAEGDTVWRTAHRLDQALAGRA